MKKHYFCNRPTLASDLIEHGFSYTTRPNPWREGFMTWVFDITPELCKIVASYHQQIGKPVPDIIQENLPEGGKADA